MGVCAQFEPAVVRLCDTFEAVLLPRRYPRFIPADAVPPLRGSRTVLDPAGKGRFAEAGTVAGEAEQCR